MDIDGRRQRAHRIVGSHHHVLRLGHGRNFLHHEDPAAATNVRLQKIQALPLNELLELVNPVIRLAAGQRNVDVIGDLFHGVVILGANRLLHPHRIVRLDRLGQADGARRLEKLGMDIDADVDVGSDGFAHRADMLGGDARGLIVRHISSGLDPHFQSGVAISLHHALGVFARLLGRRAAGALIGPDLVADTSAEQGPDWQTGGFTGDIPQGVLNAADGGVDDDATRETRGVVHQIEEILHVARIISNQPDFEVFNDFHRGFVRARGIGFADPIDPLVGEDFDVHPVTPAPTHEKCLDVGDFHRPGIADLSAI